MCRKFVVILLACKDVRAATTQKLYKQKCETILDIAFWMSASFGFITGHRHLSSCATSNYIGYFASSGSGQSMGCHQGKAKRNLCQRPFIMFGWALWCSQVISSSQLLHSHPHEPHTPTYVTTLPNYTHIQEIPYVYYTNMFIYVIY